MNDMTQAATGTRPASLTEGLVGILNRPIGAADRERAALHVLDWIGCAVAGATMPPGRAMIAYGRTMPRGQCRAGVEGSLHAVCGSYCRDEAEPAGQRLLPLARQPARRGLERAPWASGTLLLFLAARSVAANRL